MDGVINQVIDNEDADFCEIITVKRQVNLPFCFTLLGKYRRASRYNLRERRNLKPSPISGKANA